MCLSLGGASHFLKKSEDEQKQIWLVAHGKIVTADNFTIHGWPDDLICKLCHIHPETVQRLRHGCSFGAAVQERVIEWSDCLGLNPSQPRQILGHGGTNPSQVS